MMCMRLFVFPQSSWLPCFSSVSHSQPLDYVSSCSKTWRIWVGKYSHMLQYVPLSLSRVPLMLLPSVSPFWLLHLTFSLWSILSPSFLCIVSLFFCALPYLRSVTVFPRSKPLFHKNDAVVLKPPQSGKHMFLCSALVRRKLVKSLIFSQVEVDVCMPRSVFINAPHTH